MPVILWFNDSLLNTYEVALPLMQSYGYVGTMSVLTGYVGGVWPDGQWRDKPIMSLDQLMELQAAGWDMQSHSATHPNFPTLTRAVAEGELSNSKQWIKSSLGVTPRCFVWPYGQVAHEDLTRKYYTFERTTNTGLWNGVDRKIPITSDVPPRAYAMSLNLGEYQPAPKANTNLRSLMSSLTPSTYAVLLFHGIEESPEGGWETTPSEFQAVLDEIHRRGVKVVTFSEAISTVLVYVPGDQAVADLITGKLRIPAYLAGDTTEEDLKNVNAIVVGGKFANPWSEHFFPEVWEG